MDSKRKVPLEQLHVVPQSQIYKTNHQPILSEEKIVAIKDKLMLEKTAMHQTKERENNLDFYLKFNVNPFMEYKGKDKGIVQKYLKEIKQPIINVVHKLTEMDSKEPHFKKSVLEKSKQFEELKVEYSLMSGKIVNTIEQKNMNGLLIKPEVTKQKQVQVQKIKQESITEPTKKDESKNYINIDIDLIVGMAEQNFFHAEKKKVNVFKVAKGDCEQFTARQLLAKFHFSKTQSAMAEKISKMKIPIYRDISTLGRNIMVGMSTGKEVVVDLMDSNELSIKLNQLFYHDVMSVGSGRLSPETLNKILNLEDLVVLISQQVSDTSSQQFREKHIYFQANQANDMRNFINSNQQIQQIQGFKLLKLNKPQVVYLAQCKQKQQKILSELERRKKLLAETVNDDDLNKCMNQIVIGELDQFVKKDIKEIDADLIVKQSKQQKSRNQSLKMKTLLETLNSKNKYEDLLNEKFKKIKR